MRNRTFIIGWLLVIIGPCLSGSPTVSEAAEADNKVAQSGQAETEKHALLIGCTKYSNHDGWHLEGPANDVQLLRRVLIDHFGFEPVNIKTLVDGIDAEHNPTKANVRREFENLADQAHDKDQIVVLLAGHGSQQPEQDSTDPGDHKLDGLDEIFLPADAGDWDEAQQSVTNVILDHELRGWIDRIADKGAHVWVIVDACHSGTMLRGNAAETIRQVPPEALAIPREVMIRAQEKARQKSALPVSEQGTAGKIASRMKNRVGLYAAQANEPTVELALPDGAENAESHGLLTYTLCQILMPKEKVTEAPLTYRELAQRIRQQYAVAGRIAPTPLVEGGDLNNEVLGLTQWPDRSRILIGKDENGHFNVNGGTLLGLNRGCILAVFAQNSSSKQPLGYVEVTRPGVTTSQVTPCEYGSLPKFEQLPIDGRCELAFVRLDSRPLKVAVQGVNSAASNTVAIEALRKALSTYEIRQGSLIQVVSEPQKADWLLVADGKQCRLVSRNAGVPENASKVENTNSDTAFGPFEVEPLDPALQERLRQIARAQGLINLTEQSALELTKSQDAIRVKVELLRYKDRADRSGEVVDSSKGIELRSGDRIAFRLTNTGRRTAIYPTLLYIDSKYDMTSIYPREGELVEVLGHGKTLTTGVLRVNAETTGQEQLVAIAVKADGPPVDFSGLSQSSLQAARGHSEQAAVLKSPLGLLLQRALYGDGAARGLDSNALEESALGHIVWKTLSAEQH